MAWTKPTPPQIKHTCGGPHFGRLAPLGNCRRCDELRFGLPARTWGGAEKRRCEAATLAAIRAHDCTRSGCGPVCTAYQW